MIKNYIKIAFRNFRKSKLYSFINVMGLALGIACCIVIYLFIQDEYSYDRFHENAENIYRLEVIRYEKPEVQIDPQPFFDTRAPDGMRKSLWLPLPLGPALTDQFPEIEKFSRLDQSTMIVRNGSKSFEEDVLHMDASFFEIFSFPLTKGNPETVLSDPKNVVLTPGDGWKVFW